MIGKDVKAFCEDFTQIENYNEAVKDPIRAWHCHHRKEIDEGKTRNQLIKEGLYYNRPPQELIFLTRELHISIHQKGKTFSDESRKKMSVSVKKNHVGMLGKKHSETTKEKMSKAHKASSVWNRGKHLSEEHKRKLAESVKRNWLKRKGLT